MVRRIISGVSPGTATSLGSSPLKLHNGLIVPSALLNSLSFGWVSAGGAAAPFAAGAGFPAGDAFEPLALLAFFAAGAGFSAVSERTVLSWTPSTLAIWRFAACGCNSLIRFAIFWRSAATILKLSSLLVSRNALISS